MPAAVSEHVHAERPVAHGRLESEHDRPAHEAHQPRAQHQVPEPDRSDELVLDALGQHVEQGGVRHVQLADLHGRERERAHQDEHDRSRLCIEEGGQEPHRQEVHDWPEDDLEHREHFAVSHAPVAQEEGGHLHELPL